MARLLLFTLMSVRPNGGWHKFGKIILRPNKKETATKDERCKEDQNEK